VEVAALPITEFSSNGEHIAGIAEAKARLSAKWTVKYSLPSSMV